MCRWTEQKFRLAVGFQRHRHYVGFFDAPVQAPTRGNPFYTVISRNRPILSPFTIRSRYGGYILDLTPGPYGVRRHLDVQADWRSSCTFSRAPNVIDISSTDSGATLLIQLFRETAHLVAFYDTLGLRSTYSWLIPPGPIGEVRK